MTTFNRLCFIFLLLLLSISCSNNNAKITLNNTKAAYSLESKDIFLLNQYGDTLSIDKLDLASTKKYQINLQDPITGYYTLTLGEKQIKLYLTSDSDIQISLDNVNLIFTGKDSETNNYLKRKKSPEFNWYANYYKTKQTGNIIVYFRDSYINKLKTELEQITSNPQFVQTEQKELNYEYFNQLLLDKIMLETSPYTDESIIKDLEKAMSINIYDSDELNSSKNFISIVAKIVVAQNRVDELDNYYNNINHPNFKTHFLESLVIGLQKELQFGYDDYKKSKTIESFITNKQPLDSIGYNIFNIYNKFNEAKGKLANFSYENVDGEMFSLKSLRGKYVYIDFWATWCANCIKEFPYLKKLENQFRNEEITFIGISVDKIKAKEKWKKMVAQKELENIQLIAPFQGYPDRDTIDDEFMKLLYVNAYYLGIPHYTLIDPDGKIIDAYFYRPSNPKTEKYLSELLMNY